MSCDGFRDWPESRCSRNRRSNRSNRDGCFRSRGTYQSSSPWKIRHAGGWGGRIRRVPAAHSTRRWPTTEYRATTRPKAGFRPRRWCRTSTDRSALQARPALYRTIGRAAATADQRIMLRQTKSRTLLHDTGSEGARPAWLAAEFGSGRRWHAFGCAIESTAELHCGPTTIDVMKEHHRILRVARSRRYPGSCPISGTKDGVDGERLNNCMPVPEPAQLDCRISAVADAQCDAVALVLVVAGPTFQRSGAALLAADVLGSSTLALSCELRSAQPPTSATATTHHADIVTNLVILISSSGLLDV